MLYTRQILILFVGLYTVRVVLDILGVEDYGLYSVVGGVVTLLSFLSGSMTTATQRFFSFALGEKNFEKLKKTFSVNLIIYAAISLLAAVLLESIGLWFVKNKLEVPPERLSSVIVLFHFTVLTFIINIFSSPFRAIIIAHEDMHYFAYISVLEALLKLAIVFLLVVLPWDKLELYGALLSIVAVVVTSIYLFLCLKNYKECQFKKFYWDKTLYTELVSFTGWTLFGQATSVTRNQAITILLNQAFSPITVAARAIATNIASNINMFSMNFNVGLYPPIIKSYASKSKAELNSLIFNGSKITFFLMWVFALPIFLEMDTILSIWLKKPPVEALLFSRLALVETLIIAIGLPLTTAARAPGRMKKYELVLGSMQILIFLLAWIVLKLGNPAYSVYLVAISVTLLIFIVRLFLVRSLIGMRITPFFKQVLLPIISIIIISSALPIGLKFFILPKGLLYSFITTSVSFIVSIISMYFIGLNKHWKTKVKSSVYNTLQKIKLK